VRDVIILALSFVFRVIKGYTKDEEMNIERAKKIYRDDLRKGIEEQKHLRDEERNYMRLPVQNLSTCFYAL